ncbi:IS66 family transposase [Nevskia soli]|uniref:IS66 family transposase n=1 Tax=Nevskia soli TaxID=418856 RepID=UPI0004A77F93|nr:IS66 family transposase [Nevskia soli]
MQESAHIDAAQLDHLNAVELRAMVSELLVRIDQDQRIITWKDAKLAKVTFELAQLRRLKFGRGSEQMDAIQKPLFDESVEEDLAALGQDLEDLSTPTAEDKPKRAPKRTALPAHLPRVEHRHEPDSTTCACRCALKRIGEDVSEKLDYAPGVFSVDRHIRGKWVCTQCETLIQAPVASEIIDKGIPTSGLLAHLLVAKFSDHLPLYRQSTIFGRAGLAIPRSTLASWVGVCGSKLQPLVDRLKAQVLTHAVLQADETSVSTLAPGTGKTHRSYLWAYATGEFESLRAVVYDFTPSRSGEHARTFLGKWKGHLVCDDYSGYKASFSTGITEVGCMAHARRHFFELHAANKSVLAAEALDRIRQLYAIEAEIKTLQPPDRLEHRQRRSVPIATSLNEWLKAQRALVPDGSAIAKAIDYSLNRWPALTRFLADPALPIDNNHDERQIRPWAVGKKNWLFTGTQLAGERAAAIMSLIQTAKLNGHDPHAYLKDVLARLPTQPAGRLDELLPQNWKP